MINLRKVYKFIISIVYRWASNGMLYRELCSENFNISRRLIIVILFFLIIFMIISFRLVFLAISSAGNLRKPVIPKTLLLKEDDTKLSEMVRPDIVDRNGVVLASDIKVSSLYANPSKIMDIDIAVEAILSVFPDLKPGWLRRKLLRKGQFIWIKREISPAQKRAIYNKGIVGLNFKEETKRVYPSGNIASHILGHVDIDSNGIAGIERYLDTKGQLYVASLQRDEDISPVKKVPLSIDLRVQHILRKELYNSLYHYKAIGAAGVIMDVHTGEVIAMASLPDYDPNNPANSLEEKRINRVTAGVYELGSIFKAITFAMAFEIGNATMKNTYDARRSIIIDKFKIKDFHGLNRVLTLPEVFIHSSNIATAKMALEVGKDKHLEFLQRLGLLDRLRIELPESATPIKPKRWSNISSMTISYGHGLSVSPLQFATAGAALVNGGNYITPTLLRRSPEVASMISRRVISSATSEKIRRLMELNVVSGTGRKAQISGYSIGGKTGTAEKVINGKYSKNRTLTTFFAAFPISKPKYVILLMLDDPKQVIGTRGIAAGLNVVPTTGKIVAKVAPVLGIMPDLPIK